MNESQDRVQTLAEDVWQSDTDAKEFLTTPHTLLSGKTPLETAKTEEGAKQVEAILNNITWGLPR